MNEKTITIYLKNNRMNGDDGLLFSPQILVTVTKLIEAGQDEYRNTLEKSNKNIQM